MANRYETLDKIGQGSFGAVFKVKRKSDGKLFAMKQMRFRGVPPAEQQAAEREVRLLRELKHPFVLAHVDSFVEDECLNVIVELCENGDVFKAIQRQKGRPLDESFIWRCFIETVLGLHYIHSCRVLHRDIKPMNIFLDAQNHVRIGDFGVAKSLAASGDMSKTMIGTPYYLSPEVVEGREYGHKSDIWALGCVLYEMCAQKPPFDAKNQFALFVKISKENAPAIPAGYSAELRRIQLACMQKRPQLRPCALQILQNPTVIDMAKQLHVDMQLTASPSRPLTARPTSAVTVSNPIINRPPVQKPVLVPVVSNVIKRPRDRVRPAEVAKPLIPVVSRPQLIVQPIIPSVRPAAPVSANIVNVAVPSKPIQSVVPAVQNVATPSRKPSIQDLRQANNNNQPVRPASAALPSARSAGDKHGKITVHRMLTEELDLISGESNQSLVSALRTSPDESDSDDDDIPSVRIPANRVVATNPTTKVVFVSSPPVATHSDDEDVYFDEPEPDVEQPDSNQIDSPEHGVQWRIMDMDDKKAVSPPPRVLDFQIDPSIFAHQSPGVDSDQTELLTARALPSEPHPADHTSIEPFEWQVRAVEQDWLELESEEAAEFQWEHADPDAFTYEVEPEDDFTVVRTSDREQRIGELRRAIAQEKELGACLCDGGGQYATPARGRSQFSTLLSQLRDEAPLETEPSPELLTCMYKVLFLESELATLQGSGLYS